MKRLTFNKVDVPPNVVETLAYAESCGWYPFDAVKDLQHFLKIWTVTKSKVNLHEAFIRWEAWLTDQKTKKKNYRLGFLNWCLNAKAYREKAEQGFNHEKHEREKGGHPQISPRRPLRPQVGPGTTQVAAGTTSPINTDSKKGVIPAKAGIQAPSVADLAAGVVPGKTVGTDKRPEFKYPVLTDQQKRQRREEQLALAEKIKKEGK